MQNNKKTEQNKNNKNRQTHLRLVSLLHLALKCITFTVG